MCSVWFPCQVLHSFRVMAFLIDSLEVPYRVGLDFLGPPAAGKVTEIETMARDNWVLMRRHLASMRKHWPQPHCSHLG